MGGSLNEDLLPGAPWEDATAAQLGVELEQRGFVYIRRDCDGSGALAQLEVEDLWLSRQMPRTPREMLDAYLGFASDWTYEVRPTSQEFEGLHQLDQDLEKLGQLVEEAVSSFSRHHITGRSSGLLHCHCWEASEQVYFDPPPKLQDPFEAGPYLRHCSMKKVVLIYAFDASQLVLRPRAQPEDRIEVLLSAGHVLVYLHEAYDLSVESCSPAGSSTRWAVARQVPKPERKLGLFLQLDLLFERPAQHKLKQELLPLPRRLVEQYQHLLESCEMEPEEMNLISLKDLHLDGLRGISIASLHTALPSLPTDSGLAAGLEAALVGGLDPVTCVRSPPKGCSRSAEMRERQYFGAKWDLSEYYEENPTDDEMKIYSKHLSVLYQSYDVAGDFDYKLFGFELKESYQMDQRCRMLCEGHHEVLHNCNEWRTRSEPSRPWGLYMGLSAPVEPWSLSAVERSRPSSILGKVAQALHFTGPVKVEDTGDSSGLLACDFAVQQLRAGACPTAFASSASFIASPWQLALHVREGMASRSGRTRCFDQSGDGFIQGEGAVVLMLQPSTKASDARGWHVVGTANHSKGEDANLRAPSAAAMQEVLLKASRDAQLSFPVLDAAETSCCGLPTDALELQVLEKAVQHKVMPEACPVITSCSKACWGHLGVVSGLLGMARSLLLIGKQLFGPQLHLHQLLPVESDPSRLHFCTEATQGFGHTQLLSVASFGAGSHGQQLISVKYHEKVKPVRLSWYPCETKKKDVLKAIVGYEVVGTMSAWDRGLPMMPHPDDPTSFSCLLTIRLSGCEKFQIWIDGDPGRVLYPVESQTSESKVLGPGEQVDRARCWTLRDAPGHRYEIRLQVNGREKRVSWQKVSLTPLPMPPERLSVMGDHTFGVQESMKVSGDDIFGLFETQIHLHKETSTFRIFCDGLEQVFHPAPDCTPEAMLEGEDGAWTGLSGPAILGPDEDSEVSNFQITGKVGDFYRVVFDPMGKILRWQFAGHSPVEWEDVWRRQAYYVAGSWNNFQTCQEMREENCGRSRSVEVVMGSNKETFQILLNRNWLCTLHPKNGSTTGLEGPDEEGLDYYWCIGEEESFEPGDLVQINLEMDNGRASKVWWQKSESERAHKLRYCRGLQRTSQRHQKLIGLQPWDERTRKSARFTKAPDFFDGRIMQETSALRLFYKHRQEDVFRRRRQMEEEGPDARFAARSARKLGDLFKGAPPDMESAPLVVI